MTAGSIRYRFRTEAFSDLSAFPPYEVQVTHIWTRKQQPGAKKPGAKQKDTFGGGGRGPRAKKPVLVKRKPTDWLPIR